MFATLWGNGTNRDVLFTSNVSAPTKLYFPTSPNNNELIGYNLVDCPDVVFLTTWSFTANKYYEFLTGSGGTQYYNVLTINNPEIVIASPSNYDIIRNALQYPIIFDITIWLSNYDFEQVSQKRMVRSVVLGGDFFVEKMAYNVNTGNAVLTLIKKW